MRSTDVLRNCCMVLAILALYLSFSSKFVYASDTSDNWGFVTGEEDEQIESMINSKLRNKQSSMYVVADPDTVFSDFDTAPHWTNIVMRNIVKITQDRYSKRLNALKNVARKDFNVRKTKYSCANVTMIVNDPATGGSTDMTREAVKLASLYSVQNDDEVFGKDLDDYMSWLGDKRFFEVLTAEADQEYIDAGWYAKVYKWKGTMLPQKQHDKAKQSRADGTYIESDYAGYYTSALNEIVRLDPDIDVDETYELVYEYNDEGKVIGSHTELVAVTITYTIKSLSADEICESVVRFDEAYDASYTGLSSVKYRSEKYLEMCGDGDGEGATIAYFSGARAGYSGGSGSDIVAVAVAEIGTTERTGNNDIKYNDWYYGSSVSGAAYQWCCVFISWCANECGYIDSGIVQKNAGCAVMKQYYKNKMLTHAVTDSSYTPKPGDFIIMGDNGHIGLVEKYEDEVLYTIEGNSGTGISDTNNNGGCVARHAYGKGYPLSITGRWGMNAVYCSPEYPVSSDAGNACLLAWAYETGGGIYGKYDLWMHKSLPGEGFDNYGAMSANNAAATALYNYIKSNSSNFSAQIGAKRLHTAAFDSWWTGSHSESDNDEMFRLQSQWTWDYIGADAAKGQYSFMGRSEALRAVAISRAVHRGAPGAVGMFRKAGISESMTDEQIANAVYDYEINNITAKVSSYTPALRSRMRKEKQMLFEHYF